MFELAKVDERAKQVFGFANVAVKRDGEPMVDLQDDEIPVDVLEKAAYDFVLRFRECGEMHEDDCAKGRLIESVMITPEKLEAWGLAKDAVAPRWWVGFQLDDETFKKVATGQYRMFSIQGRAVSEEVAA
jgi:hypothetical protein